MTELEIKKLISSYRLKASLYLLGACLFMTGSIHFLAKSNIEKHFELGLTLPSSSYLQLWPFVGLGLFSLLYICFHAFESILLKVYAEERGSINNNGNP
jgi:hypothetical protein